MNGKTDEIGCLTASMTERRPTGLEVISSEKSKALFAEALKHIPGGVNSPVRAFRAVGGQPFFVESASGSRVFDIDGNSYIDYVCTWGPAILGHAHPGIIQAVKDAA